MLSCGAGFKLKPEALPLPDNGILLLCAALSTPGRALNMAYESTSLVSLAINEVSSVLSNLAKGDLTKNIEVEMHSVELEHHLVAPSSNAPLVQFRPQGRFYLEYAAT